MVVVVELSVADELGVAPLELVESAVVVDADVVDEVSARLMISSAPPHAARMVTDARMATVNRRLIPIRMVTS